MPPRRRSLRLKKHEEGEGTIKNNRKLVDVMGSDSPANIINKAYQAPTGSLIHADTFNMTQVDIPEMEEASEAEMSAPNHLDQMEGPNIQASRANKNHNKSISMAERPSRSFSLNQTEMVKMCDDNEDEVNSVGQSLPTGTVDAYQVKPESIPLLKKILNKHGDIAKNCTISTMKYRSTLLEMICDIFSELQDEDLGKIKEDNLQDMIALVNEMKNMKVDIGWLQMRLFQILEAKHILSQSSTLKEAEKKNNAVAEKLRSIHAKETICKETLAKARDECTAIAATIADAKSKVRRFHKCSLVDGLL
ncbi:uncharacterized protein LOC133294738 [Gastrolobium bilobum]|uniref:uncharacterized protein LOC133294738 n=1 Tax=Gastrolobium bilobum TaxID=150636 RepID=UPI002AAF24BA|nr:uncharacterized protein LOC133294738 [Gastrolobium bilobum]